LKKGLQPFDDPGLHFSAALVHDMIPAFLLADIEYSHGRFFGSSKDCRQPAKGEVAVQLAEEKQAQIRSSQVGKSTVGFFEVA
jgi:hypothetical protein